MIDSATRLATLLRWPTILISAVAGAFIPFVPFVVALTALFFGYTSCQKHRWPRYQLFLAHVIGGLCCGAAYRCMLVYWRSDQEFASVIAPLLVLLGTRALFLFFEGRYALQSAPKADTPTTAQIALEPADHEAREDASAWSGASSGRSANGEITWEFFMTGEIAMGGPIYGDVVFSNGVALRDVGPSIVASDDGRYAAMTLPSRSEWHTWLVDLRDRKLYALASDSALWEIDRIADGFVFGRHSPLTSNAKLKLRIADVLATATSVDLVASGSRWVHPAQHIPAPPDMGEIVVTSPSGAHVARLIPEPISEAQSRDRNPLQDHPVSYALTVDDIPLALRTSHKQLIWVDSVDGIEGRFLYVGKTVVDFWDVERSEFAVKRSRTMEPASFDELTYVALDREVSGERGELVIEGTTMLRSTRAEAEFDFDSYTWPWDEETTRYWDRSGVDHTADRKQRQRYYRYRIDLHRWSTGLPQYECTLVELVNRADPSHTARFEFVDRDIEGRYCGYRCITSCGIDPGVVTHEACWSQDGRYLAVVAFAKAPRVPHRIRIINFESRSIVDVPGCYALPTFIWFDNELLEFTHALGVRESITFGPGRADQRVVALKETQIDAAHDLLIAGLTERRARVEAEAQRRRQGSYAGGSAHLYVQHCILFAPRFDEPVAQPPTIENSR